MRLPSAQPPIHEVAIIAPDLKLYRVAKSLRDETPVNYSVRLGFVESAHKIAPRLVAEGAKVLISRGVTTDIIRGLNLPVPVLDILVSEHDTATMLTQARAYSSRIAVVGFSGLIKAAKELSPLLSLDIGIFRVNSLREIYTSVQQARNRGYTVVVGNSYAIKFAERLGLNGVSLITPAANVLNVISEAGKVAAALAREGEWRLRQQVLLNSISESIISIDEEGTLVSGTSPFSDRGAQLVDTFGGQEEMRRLLQQHGVLASIQQGRTWEGEIAAERGDPYQCRVVPVQSGTKNRGAIMLASLAATPGESARRKIFQKGLIARYHLEDMLHNSKAMAALLDRARRYAVSEAPLFISGESGTGKEMLAQGIHNASRRRYGPFVAVSCAAIPENLLESELFGYQEGAFTGAKKSGKPGLLELADTGTLFLDEVAELSLLIQAKLLRVLEEQAFMRVGGDRVIRTDVRIICAANRDLAPMVNSGEFRLDLYYRLSALYLRLPPMRERFSDIALLAEHAVREVCRRLDRPVPLLAPDTLEELRRHPFPGNVRELFGIFERVLAATDDAVIDAAGVRAHLDTHIVLAGEESPRALARGQERPAGIFPFPARAEDQTAVLRHALHRARGNKSEAARLLGISTTTLWRRLKRLETKNGAR